MCCYGQSHALYKTVNFQFISDDGTPSGSSDSSNSSCFNCLKVTEVLNDDMKKLIMCRAWFMAGLNALHLSHNVVKTE